MFGSKEDLEWWHSLSQKEQQCLFRLAMKADPTIKDRLLSDMAKQTQREEKQGKNKGKAENRPR